MARKEAVHPGTSDLRMRESPPIQEVAHLIACMSDGSTYYRGTGFLVKLEGLCIVLTAAHILVDENTLSVAKEVDIIFGHKRREASCPFIKKSSKDIYVHPHFRPQHDSDDVEQDLAFIFLGKDEPFCPCKYFDLVCLDEGKLNCHKSNKYITGFPSFVRESRRYSQYSVKLTKISCCQERRFLTYSDATSEGMSGSPLYFHSDVTFFAFGLHVNGENGAIRFCTDDIVSLRTCTLKIAAGKPSGWQQSYLKQSSLQERRQQEQNWTIKKLQDDLATMTAGKFEIKNKFKNLRAKHETEKEKFETNLRKREQVIETLKEDLIISRSKESELNMSLITMGTEKNQLMIELKGMSSLRNKHKTEKRKLEKSLREQAKLIDEQKQAIETLKEDLIKSRSKESELNMSLITMDTEKNQLMIELKGLRNKHETEKRKLEKSLREQVKLIDEQKQMNGSLVTKMDPSTVRLTGEFSLPMKGDCYMKLEKEHGTKQEHTTEDQQPGEGQSDKDTANIYQCPICFEDLDSEENYKEHVKECTYIIESSESATNIDQGFDRPTAKSTGTSTGFYRGQVPKRQNTTLCQPGCPTGPKVTKTESRCAREEPEASNQ